MGKRIPAWILGPVWKAPYPTILITLTIVKVAGVIPWKNKNKTLKTMTDGPWAP